MRALVIGHDHVAGIEHVGVELERRGFELEWLGVVPEARFSRPDVEVEFPADLDRWDLVVTLGAPWPRDAIVSWTGRETEFLARVCEAGTPLLAICFGAQLLAEALGAATMTLPTSRIGWFPVVSRCEEVAEGPWFQWNGDQLTAPPGSDVLAVSEQGVEAFRAGRAVGVQFHPEMTPRLLDRWLSLPGGPPAGLDVKALRAETERHVANAERSARALIDLF